MKSLIGEEEQFVGDSEVNREPVETFEGGCDVLPASGAGEHSGSRVLYILQSVQGCIRETEEDGIAVVKT